MDKVIISKGYNSLTGECSSELDTPPVSQIIDGVDVSECEYANACDKKLKCVILQDDVCETKPYCEGYDCYYKQLQRAKVENKELERKYADVLKLAKENADSNEYCLQELEKENERLKAENLGLCKALKVKEFERLKQSKRKLKNIKYALQEIREIAENVCRDDCPDLQNGYCIGLGECSFRARKQIIDKINSVIGAE